MKPAAPTVYARAERVAPNIARLTVKVNMPRADGGADSIPKAAPVRSEAYRRLVAALPCASCRIEGNSQAAHPPPTGKGIKESDLDCFPLCRTRPGIEGCHSDFDKYRLVPKADMRSLAGHWAADTRRLVKEAGAWPKALPHLEIQQTLGLIG
jgi:hypothetical protein